MPTFPPVEEQLAALLRGTAQTETTAELRKKLERSHATGKPLRVKYGIDPTGVSTSTSGTPCRFASCGSSRNSGTPRYSSSGRPPPRSATRAAATTPASALTPEQIETNAGTYLTQIAKVVDVTKAEVRPNGEWFSKFRFTDMLKLLGQMTMQRMLERDDFTKRVKAGTPHLHARVPVPADARVGQRRDQGGRGTRRHGATVQLDGRPPTCSAPPGKRRKICMTMPILRGTDGEKKMGKNGGELHWPERAGQGAVREDNAHPGRLDARVVHAADRPHADGTST